MAFPVNVPRVPGVPSVLFASAVSQALTFLTQDAVGIFTGLSQQQPWGIYLGGSPVVLADNVVSFDLRKQWAISDYPVEQGAFASYNKVFIPFDGRFKFTAGGSDAKCQALLTSIDAIAGDLNLYTIVTPIAIYPSVNITHYDYSQTATNGVGLLSVDVWTEEVRETGAQAMSNTASPTAASQVNGGTVQPVAATPAQAAQTGPIAAAGG
jgi:hypothetical protein